LEDWDDFDVQVYTRDKPKLGLYYEILKDGGKHYLLSAFYFRLNRGQSPVKTVLQKRSIRVLYGDEKSLRHIHVERSRRVEPIPHELPRFKEHQDTNIAIFLDMFFILNRAESRKRMGRVKARLARDAVRTFARHFYEFYGIDRQVGDRARWRSVMKDVGRLLQEKKFEELCRNREFASAAIDLIVQYS
jgi:hypothetical protein